jgi:predicted DNA-binding transcriptional regulator YafY
VIVSDREDLARRLGVRQATLPPDVGTHLVSRTTSPDLSLALEALQLRCRITFSYKGTRRSLSPGSVRLQNYGWYLSGIETDSDTVKHFSINRMSDTALDKPGTADPVPQVRAIPLHPLHWEVDPPVQVVIRAVADYVPDVQRWLSLPEVSVSGEGTVDMTYSVTNRAAFRARLYVLGDRVAVVGPDEFRAELLAELKQLVGR